VSAASRLLAPLAYLRIEHPAKLKYDFMIPAVLAAVGGALFYFVPHGPPIFGSTGLVALVNNLLQVLTGFFIASLAAVATFNKEGMDATMPGDPPKLQVMDRGTRRMINLSRRRFLSLMFGYLSFLSLFIYVLGGVANLFADPAKALISPDHVHFIKWCFLFPYLLMLSNLSVTTLLGLFYMADRIHRHDPMLQWGPGNEGK